MRTSILKGLTARLKSGARDESGAAAIIFAVALVLLAPLTLGVFDLYIAANQKQKLQDALDAAALYAARSSAQTQKEINEIGQRALQANLSSFPGSALITSSFVLDGPKVVGSAEMTPMAVSAGFFEHSNVTAGAEVLRAMDRLEVALVLDNTGSMSGTKLSTLKTAAKDLVDKLEAAGCNMVFTPTPATMYPDGLDGQTLVRVPEVSEGLCGGARPGHFDGVSTVVSMLFHIVQPDVACFGEKDYQQLAVIRRMVSDMHMPIEIVGVPTVREPSGLALSSRNGYLSEAEHATAAELQATLVTLARSLEAGADIDATLAEGRVQLASQGFAPDYLELRARDLGAVTATTRDAILLVAAHLGATRLIDNLTVTLPR